MAALYFDSSALVKRYVIQTGSTWVQRLTDPPSSHDIQTVTLTAPEMIATLARLSRGRILTSSAASHAIMTIRHDWSNLFTTIDVTDDVIGRAMDIAQAYGLRGYDAVHVAAAMVVEDSRRALHLDSILIVSADREQLSAAAAEGLLTDDPNAHP